MRKVINYTMRFRKKNRVWQRVDDLGPMSMYLARMDREALEEEET